MKQGDRAVDIAVRKNHLDIVELFNPKTKSKRKRNASAKIHSSAEFIASPPNEKKKNKFLSFFSRRKKSKNFIMINGELTSPDDGHDAAVTSPVDIDPLELIRMYHRMEPRHSITQIVRQQSTDGNLSTFRPVPQPPKIEPVIPLTKYHITSPVVNQPNFAAGAPKNPGFGIHEPTSSTAAEPEDPQSECSPWVLQEADNKLLASAHVQRRQPFVEHHYYEMMPRHIAEFNSGVTVGPQRRPVYVETVNENCQLARCRSDDTLSTTSGAVCDPHRQEKHDRSGTSSSNSRHLRTNDTPPSSSSSSSTCHHDKSYDSRRKLKSGGSKELLHCSEDGVAQRQLRSGSTDATRAEFGRCRSGDEKTVAERKDDKQITDDAHVIDDGRN